MIMVMKGNHHGEFDAQYLVRLPICYFMLRKISYSMRAVAHELADLFKDPANAR